MRLVARDYEWLTVEDGAFSVDMRGTTVAEMDRRLVISQELSAGRVDLINGWVPASSRENR